jgi:hypothetical protein
MLESDETDEIVQGAYRVTDNTQEPTLLNRATENTGKPITDNRAPTFLHRATGNTRKTPIPSQKRDSLGHGMRKTLREGIYAQFFLPQSGSYLAETEEI